MGKPNLRFQEYAAPNYHDCMELFERNCPSFFAEEEREDFIEFLESDSDNFLLGYEESTFVCCFGIEDHSEEVSSIRWMMVHPNFHHGGYGNAMMSYFMRYVRERGTEKILIATSQHASAFFEKYGASQLDAIEDGWGKGMHKINMQITL